MRAVVHTAVRLIAVCAVARTAVVEVEGDEVIVEVCHGSLPTSRDTALR